MIKMENSTERKCRRNSWLGKTVLVTGGAGAIGAMLVRRLVEQGAAKIYVLDDLSYGFRWRIPSRRNVYFVLGSVTNDAKLNEVFAERPNIIFHLAAFFANERSIEQPEQDLLVNGLGTLKVLEYALRFGAKRVVYTASSSSRPGFRQGKDGRFVLRTPYQMTKLVGEFYCDFFSRYYDLPTVRVRLFNSYGPGDVPGRYRNVIPNFIYLALQGRPLPITGNGSETRDFTFVEDHVEGLVRAAYIEHEGNWAVDFGSGVETTIAELATTINELTGNSAGLSYVARRKWDTTKRRLAKVDTARSVINYVPRVPLQIGLVRTIHWFKENWETIRKAAGGFPDF